MWRGEEGGLLALPEKVRRAAAFVPGMEVEIEVGAGALTLRPRRPLSAQDFRRRPEAVRGTADAGLSTDEIMALTRGRIDHLRGVETIPAAALFAAGKAFAAYRGTAGTRTGVLPDLFIGAHAAALGCPVLTRDPRSFRTYFSEDRVITPS